MTSLCGKIHNDTGTTQFTNLQIKVFLFHEENNLMWAVFFFCSEFYCLSIGAKRSGAVLGEVVMEGNVVVFDRANQRIGFAPSNISHAEVGPCGKKTVRARRPLN